MFQQLDLVSPFQLYFNPILIVEQYQVRKYRYANNYVKLALLYKIIQRLLLSLEENLWIDLYFLSNWFFCHVLNQQYNHKFSKVLYWIISDMAINNNISVLWKCWIQSIIQYDLHISILSYVGGRILPQENSWFCDDVYFWWIMYDCILGKF